MSQYHEQFEEAIIGCVLLDPTILDSVGGELSATDFADDQLGKLFAVMVDRHDAGLPANDTALLIPDARPIFGETAAGTLAELATKVPHAAHAIFYAKQISEASRRRQLSAIGTEIVTRCEDATETVEGVTGFASARLESIGADATSQATNIHDAGEALVAELLRPSTRRPVMTGIDSVDQVAGGLLPGELEIIAARPGNGKTSFAMQIAKRLADQSRPVLFVSLEMQATELVGRILCGIANVDSRHLRRGQVEPAKIANANAELEGLPLTVFDPPTATMQQIRAVAKMQAASAGLDALFVDYIGLVQPRDRRQPRTEQVSEITAGLKRLAKELAVPVFALCQLNRQADGAEPKLSHLRESGSVEQDADVVVFIHRVNQSNEFKLIIGKHRHGETGSLSVTFDAKATRFDDKAVREWGE